VEYETLKIISTDSTGIIFVPNAGMLDDVKSNIVNNDILHTPVVGKPGSEKNFVELSKLYLLFFIINIVLAFVVTHYRVTL